MIQEGVINFHEHPHDGLVAENAAQGIAASVLLSVGNAGMAHSVALAQRHPDRMIPFYWVDHTGDLSQEPERLRRAVDEWGVRGVKFQPMDQHWFADDPRLYPIYAVCAELGLVCTWHAGVVNLSFKYELGEPMLARYTAPLPLDQVAFDFPELKLCIAHLGGNYYHEALVLAEKHPHIYLDTAFLPFFAPRRLPPVARKDWIAHAAHIAGAEKILYGGEGTLPIDVLAADLTPHEQQLILSENARRLLSP